MAHVSQWVRIVVAVAVGGFAVAGAVVDAPWAKGATAAVAMVALVFAVADKPVKSPKLSARLEYINSSGPDPAVEAHLRLVVTNAPNAGPAEHWKVLVETGLPYLLIHTSDRGKPGLVQSISPLDDKATVTFQSVHDDAIGPSQDRSAELSWRFDKVVVVEAECNLVAMHMKPKTQSLSARWDDGKGVVTDP